MGEVYRAKDTRLGREVAVKVLPAAWAADAQRRLRFEREARAVAALNHPNICTIHDVGRDQGLDFLVMELVDGDSLSTRLAKGPLPLDQALGHAIEIADALDKAHRQGIIHRDLKPGNVMLARTGSGKSHGAQAKLLDFGLARIVPVGAGAGVAPTDTTPKTEAGALLGTLQYMAPEQIEGRSADARTDIFAFGALLHEMLTGRRAFEGTSTAGLMAAILREDPPPVHPREAGRIVRRCLEKDPLRRYQSARDLLNDLEEVKDDLDSGRLQTSSASPAHAGRRVRRWAGVWIALGLVCVVGAGAGYVRWRRLAAPSAVSGRFQLPPPQGVGLLPTGVRSVLAVSPDGQWVAFGGVGAEPNANGLFLRPIRELGATRIAPAATTPFFSPDSRWLGFFAENAMYKVSVDGGRPQRICSVPNTSSIRGASWSDNETIVFSLDRALWRVSSAGGDPTVLTRPASNGRHYWPQVLPGSAAAVFTFNEGYNDRWRHIGVVSLKTGESRTLPELSGTAARYVSSGHLVYSRFGVLHAAPFDLSRLEVTGKPIKILDNVHTFAGSGSVSFDVSATGSLVYIPEGGLFPEGDILWLDRQGKVAPLLEERKRYLGAAFDPEGKRLVAAIADDFGEADLWIHEIERGARETWGRVTYGMHAWSELAWSPDGQWIFFTSFKSGEGELFRMPSRGGSPEQLTFDVTVWEHPGSVTPDGTTLLFWQAPISQSDLMTLKLEPRGTPQPLTNSPEFLESSPRISPKGRWVAYVSNESGSAQIHVRPFPGPGEGVRVSSDGGTTPWWSRDGRELFYRRAAEIWAVVVEPGAAFRHGPPRMLFKADFLGSSGTLVTAGGTDRFAVIRREEPHRQLVYVPNWLEELKQAFRQTQ
jgi:eukaryotic-like serine/threonine-protein kinase